MQENTYSKKELANGKRYFAELMSSIIVYTLVLIGSIYLAKNMEAGLSRTLLVLTPTLPAFAALWAIVRAFRRMDEYMRVWLLEILAISGAITAFFSFSYGFLEGIGYPKLSGFITYAIFMGSWLALSFIRKFMER
jgi:hypothetical protein